MKPSNFFLLVFIFLASCVPVQSAPFTVTPSPYTPVLLATPTQTPIPSETPHPTSLVRIIVTRTPFPQYPDSGIWLDQPYDNDPEYLFRLEFDVSKWELTIWYGDIYHLAHRSIPECYMNYEIGGHGLPEGLRTEVERRKIGEWLFDVIKTSYNEAGHPTETYYSSTESFIFKVDSSQGIEQCFVDAERILATVTLHKIL